MRNVWILGSTGSIGTQALDVIRRHPGEFHVAGLGAGGANVALLAEQVAEFQVPMVALARSEAVAAFREAFAAVTNAPIPEILAGDDALAQLASLASGGTALDSDAVVAPDVILNGITGSVGLGSTLAALATGATLALANKESLVAGGALVREAMVRPGQIVPVDSEHCAIFQALQAGVHHRGLTSANLDGESNVARIILTASGGPFRGLSRKELEGVTLEQALAHPTWNMGPVVTINSATLMNKGLELIEAAYLFDMPPADIVPVVHPQSAVHSMVEFVDGSTIAQASPPDMRLPIALGMSWPARLDHAAPTFDWGGGKAAAKASPLSWTFEPLDHEAFPAVQLARAAFATSPLHPAVLNAANEEAVAAFAARRLSFLGITDVVAQVLADYSGSEPQGGAGVLKVDHVTAAESWARAQANQIIGE